MIFKAQLGGAVLAQLRQGRRAQCQRVRIRTERDLLERSEWVAAGECMGGRPQSSIHVFAHCRPLRRAVTKHVIARRPCYSPRIACEAYTSLLGRAAPHNREATMDTLHEVCTPDEWNDARKELLNQEKQFTRLRDQLSAKRRALPWLRVEQPYTFEGKSGTCSLSDLFGGRSQLLVYHFMFAPEWEAGCTSCSFWAESFDRNLIHLAQRDLSFAAISRAPVHKLSAYAQRMGWSFPWFSSQGSSFNYDFAVSFTEEQRASGRLVYNFGTQAVKSSDMPGFSVFTKGADGSVFRSYSCYSRGIDMMNPAYQYLDLVPKGRDEAAGAMKWLRRHDQYER
jgi:predicted dithiol-disulfide oxidoreductase (DUF899 family)